MSISILGVVAYLLLWAGTVSGIAVSSPFLRRRAGTWLDGGGHEMLSLAGLSVAVLHGARSVAAPQGRQLALLVFAGPDLATGWGLFVGVLALYLTVAAVAAFYLRRRLGGWWCGVHMLAYPAYGAALWHAVAIGANAWFPPLRWLYIVTVALVVALSGLRVSEAISRPRIVQFDHGGHP